MPDTPLNLKRNTFSVEPRICTRDNSPLNGAPEEFSVSDFQLDILPFDEDPGSVSNRPFEDVPDVPMQDTQDMLDNYQSVGRVIIKLTSQPNGRHPRAGKTRFVYARRGPRRRAAEEEGALEEGQARDL
jgi:hypothetical protein